MCNAIVMTNMNDNVDCNICLETNIRCNVECKRCVDKFCCELCSVQCLTFNLITLSFAFSCPFCRRQIPFERNYISYITSRALEQSFVIKVQLPERSVYGKLTGVPNDRIIIKYNHNGITTTLTLPPPSHICCTLQ